MMEHKYVTTIFLVLVAGMLLSCNPRELPIIGDSLEEQTRIRTRETEKAIEKSPTLKAISETCKEIQIPKSFKLVSKNYALQKKQYLNFGYRSDEDFSFVSSYFFQNLTKNGWNHLNKSSIGIYAIKFRKNNYYVSISHTKNTRGANYSVYCERLSA